MIQSYLDNCGNSRANTCTIAPTLLGEERVYQFEASRVARPVSLVTLDNSSGSHGPEPATHLSSVCPIRLSMVSAMLTMVITGNGESGFDSGEGA